ncbi:NF-kappa-B essential modulator isoform 2-T3 [Discoglossus pictus]
MSVRGKPVEMVQPNESPGSDYTMCGGGPGDASLGKPATLPPELTNNEAFRCLLVENQDLRDALEQSNLMLRKRHSEILEFQEAQKKEREFITFKFTEARKLVEKLTQERRTLQAQLDEARKKLTEAAIPGEDTGKRPQEETTYTDQRLPQKTLNEDTQSNFTGTMDNTSPGSSLSSCETLTRSMCETIRQTVFEGEGPARVEQELHLLREANAKLEKMHLGLQNTDPVKIREEIGDRESRIESNVLQGAGGRNTGKEQELQKKLQVADAQNIQLQQQITVLQVEISELRRQILEKGAETQRKVQALQQQLEHLAEEKATIKAQVTSLLGELKESQMSLESCVLENRKLEESLRLARDLQQESETQVKQHMVQLDQRRMQVQNLDTALKLERQKTCEEMKKLAQLQAAYHHLFQEYDTHIKNSIQQERHSNLQELKQQLQEAEEALVAKQELIDKLKEEAEQYRSQLVTVDVLKAQADIFRSDFLAERKAREELHAEKERLQEQLEDLQREKVMIEEMRNRHLDNIRPNLLPGSYAGPGSYLHAPTSSFHAVQEPPEFCCPKCQYKAPDMDTLQIHIMDCIK